MKKETIEPFYIALGLRLRAIRSAQGKTQEELAKSVIPPMTRAAIANMEGGKQRVRAHTLWELAKALDVTPLELVPDSREQEKRAARLSAVQSELQRLIPELAPDKIHRLSNEAVNALASNVPKGKKGGGE